MVLIQKLKAYISTNKKTSIASAMAIILLGYWGYGKLTTDTTIPSYVMVTAQRETMVSSVTGTGQVSASNQVDIKPQVSGQITWIGVQAGDTVHAGQALLGIDSIDAQTAVTNAEQSIITSRLQYQKDEAQSPVTYQNNLDSLTNAQIDLATTFNDTFNTLSNTYLDMPTVITGTQNIIQGFDLSPANSQQNVDVISDFFNNDDASKEKIAVFASSSRNDYALARTKYDASFLAYKQISRSSAPSDTENFLNQSIDTTTAIAQALQSELNLLGSAIDIAQLLNRKLPLGVATLQSNARAYLSTTNADLSNLLAQKKSITSNKQSVTTYQQNILLLKVGNTDGSNPISLQIEKNNLEAQEQSLVQLRQKLSNYTVVAPFDGVLSAVTAKKGDTASGAVASIVTTQTLATISLNEVDVAKIKIGQKATLTFDAIDALTLTGKVAEIDAVGTVSQGVVTYNVKISFDAQDPNVKPGMSTSAAIITDTKQDVLTVPNSAIKTNGATSYVQMFTTPLTQTSGNQGVPSIVPPREQPVEVGTSNDTVTEIISGLKEGDQVVSRIITTTAKLTTKTAPSLLGGGSTRAFTGGVKMGN